MKRFGWLAAWLLAAGVAGPALAQMIADYPEAGLMVQAQAKARAEAGRCLAELKGGKSGAACGRYHQAVAAAMAQDRKRVLWCNGRMTEASNVVVPDSCVSKPVDLKIDQVATLERKVDPKGWKAFEKQMGQYAN